MGLYNIMGCTCINCILLVNPILNARILSLRIFLSNFQQTPPKRLRKSYSVSTHLVSTTNIDLRHIVPLALVKTFNSSWEGPGGVLLVPTYAGNMGNTASFNNLYAVTLESYNL